MFKTNFGYEQYLSTLERSLRDNLIADSDTIDCLFIRKDLLIFHEMKDYASFVTQAK